MLTPVLVRLDLLYPHPPDAPHQVVPDGLDLVGEVPGMLSGWLRSARGPWLAVLSSLEIPYADGRRHKVRLVDQVVPGHCVRVQDGGPDERPGRDPPPSAPTGATRAARGDRRPD